MLQFLQRAFTRRPPKPEIPSSAPFHSRSGGLWVDRADAQMQLAWRNWEGSIPPHLRGAVASFISDGYALLPRAVSETLADRLSATVAAAYEKGDERLRYHTDGTENLVPQAGTDPRGKRIVEAHAVLAEARDALSAPAIMEFLRIVFEEPPVLTQTLIFHTGSEQPFHQDPAFVVFEQPLRMAACWIALEDIKPGSGELRYQLKSHRLPDYVFSTNLRSSHGAGPDEVPEYLTWLKEEAKTRNLMAQTFLAKKGDVLVWHADLSHGGSPITDPRATRRSLVGHFCPVSNYPSYKGARIRRQHGEMTYSTYMYDLDAIEPAAAPGPGDPAAA